MYTAATLIKDAMLTLFPIALNWFQKKEQEKAKKQQEDRANQQMEEMSRLRDQHSRRNSKLRDLEMKRIGKRRKSIKASYRRYQIKENKKIGRFFLAPEKSMKKGMLKCSWINRSLMKRSIKKLKEEARKTKT